MDRKFEEEKVKGRKKISMSVAAEKKYLKKKAKKTHVSLLIGK